MTEHLPTITGQRPHGDGGIALELGLPSDLLWFQGHFPDFPILPGVVQIHWVLHFARLHLGLDLPSAQEYQIKFKALIRPGESLWLVLAPDFAKKRLDFDYCRGEQVCCTGRVFLP